MPRSPVPTQGAGSPACRSPADPLRWFRPDALAVFGRHPTPDEVEALDERAGIIEYDAGLTRQQAESATLLTALTPDDFGKSERRN